MSAKKNESKDTAVVHVEESSALALAAEFDYGEDAGSGHDQVKPSDLKTPFLNQLQPLSPAVAEGKVEGAKSGMFLNSVTQELYPMEQGVVLTYISHKHHYVEWGQKKLGGGFKGTHELTSPFVAKVIAANGGRKFGKLLVDPSKPESSTELVESFDVFAMLLEKSGLVPTGDAVIIPFTSTKIKAFQKWITKLYTVKPDTVNGQQKKAPLWAYRSHLVGFKDPDTSKGHFWNVEIKPFMPRPELAEVLKSEWKATLIQRKAEAQLFETAKAFFELSQSGEVKADYASQTNDSGAAQTEEEIPF